MNAAMAYRHFDYRLVAACVAGSIALHVWLLIMLPSWNAARESLPPLIVELAKQESAPEIEPPKPLPLQPRHDVRKPEPIKPVPQPRTPQTVAEEKNLTSPVLTAPPEAVTPSTPVIAAESRASPPDIARTQPAPVTAPAVQPRVDPSYLHHPEPAYPLVALRRGETGTVYVLVRVTPDGRAASVTMNKSSGSSVLDEAATRAVRGWRFSPARQGTQAVEGEVIVPVVFKLN